MNHETLLQHQLAQAKADDNLLGYLLFGSVARGTHREDSDIDVITIRRENRPAAGMSNEQVSGIKVGDLFMTYDILEHSAEHVPYLLHTLVDAKLLFDREGTVAPQQEKIRSYFAAHPEVVAEWQEYYRQFSVEKAAYGYEKTTIIEVWNELEARHSGGKTKRRFFNAFYFAKPRVFAIVKWFLFLSAPEPKPRDYPAQQA